jgi:tetrahydromethanopterin S-methyltransferase subunit G
MLSKHTEEDVRRVFSRVGLVSRVDFTPINKRPGFGEHLDELAKSAFVHFSELEEFSAIRHVIENGNSYKIFLDNSNEYWMCYKNIHPVPSTMMNIHQVVENCTLMENAIEKQEKKMKEQEDLVNEISKKIDKMSKKLEGIHTVVYQLIGGLYCQTTQVRQLESNLVDLGIEQEYSYVDDKHRWTIWPTTRQGDENERRLDELEKTVNRIVESVLETDDDDIQDNRLYRRKIETSLERNLFNFDEDVSVNTYYAIKENKGVKSVPEDDDMSVSSEFSDEIKNSYDLCDR